MPAMASTIQATLDDEFRPVDLSTLEIDVDDRVKGLRPLEVSVQGGGVDPRGLDLPPEPIQIWSGILGTIVLAVGAFVPVLDGTGGGSRNLLEAGAGEGYILLAVAITSGIMAARRRFRWLYIPAVIAGAIVVASYLWHLGFAREVKDVLRGGINTNSVRLMWGWIVPAAGSVMLFLASALHRRKG